MDTKMAGFLFAYILYIIDDYRKRWSSGDSTPLRIAVSHWNSTATFMWANITFNQAIHLFIHSYWYFGATAIASGGSVDWAHATQNTAIAYTFELRPGSGGGASSFILPAQQIIPNSEEFFDGLAAMIQQARTMQQIWLYDDFTYIVFIQKIYSYVYR